MNTHAGREVLDPVRAIKYWFWRAMEEPVIEPNPLCLRVCRSSGQVETDWHLLYLSAETFYCLCAKPGPTADQVSHKTIPIDVVLVHNPAIVVNLSSCSPTMKEQMRERIKTMSLNPTNFRIRKKRRGAKPPKAPLLWKRRQRPTVSPKFFRSSLDQKIDYFRCEYKHQIFTSNMSTTTNAAELETFLVHILPDTEIRNSVLDLLARIVQGRQAVRMVYIFQGSGSNGKTTLLNLIHKLLPNH